MDVNESKGGSGEDIFDDSAFEGIIFDGIGTLDGNGPLPNLPLFSPSGDIATLRASSAKYSRFIRTRGMAPKEGDYITSKKGLEQWTPEDAANLRKYKKGQKKGDFVQPLPILPLPSPSVDEEALRASNTKHRRFNRVLGRLPKEGDYITSKKGLEQWTPEDAANLRKYKKGQRNGDFVQPLPILPLPSPSGDIAALRASSAKHARFKKVLGTAPKEGDSITSKKGLEQWTLQDTADFREYKRRHTKRKASSDTVREETNIGFSAFLAPMNSDRTKDDGSSKKRKSDSDQKSPSKRPGLR